MDAPPEAAASEQDGAFGARLRRAREAAGLAQEELAERAGLSVNTVGGLERGEHRHPHPATVRSLADALGLDDAERATLSAASRPRGRPATATDATSSRLPAPLSSLIGREGEVAAVAALLRDDVARLVTLTGPGGVGKTRLALQIATHLGGAFTHGAAFVALAPVRDPALVATTVAHVLGVTEVAGWAPVDRLGDALRDRHLLLVLDNLEHLLDVAPLVTDLLGRCPRLKVLATSRATLRLDGEQVFPVPPLAVPDPERLPVLEQLAEVAAVRLFVDRARAADPGFTLTDDNAGAVAAVCHRLDGLPLAIELAAARTALLPPAVLLPLLARRLPILTAGRRDAPARQRTLRDAIAWSYDLLTSEEQAVFRCLAVFVGGFSLEAAQAVAAAAGKPNVDAFAGIAALVDHSLLRHEPGPGGVPRYVMLETIREYGLERLAAVGGEADAAAAHAAYFGTLDEHLDPNRLDLGGLLDDRLRLTEADHPNLLAALDWMATSGDAAGVLRLAASLATFWHHRGYLREGRRWLEWALEHALDAPLQWRGRALAGLSMVIYAQGDPDATAPPAEAALAIAREVGDPDLTALAVHMIGMAELTRGRWDRAEVLMAEALRLERASGVPGSGAMALQALSSVAHCQGDLDLSERRAEEALALFRAVGHDSGAALALTNLARVAADRGNDRQALAAFKEALRLWAGMGERWLIVQALVGLAALAATHRSPEHAATLVGATDAQLDEVGTTLISRDRVPYDQAVSRARAALGAARFAAIRDAGRTRPMTEVVALTTTLRVSDPSGKSDVRTDADC